jgi:hypothetical protein
VTAHDIAPVVVHVLAPGELVTVYPVIALEPLEAGADQEMRACPAPGVAVTPVGAPGACPSRPCTTTALTSEAAMGEALPSVAAAARARCSVVGAVRNAPPAATGEQEVVTESGRFAQTIQYSGPSGRSVDTA